MRVGAGLAGPSVDACSGMVEPQRAGARVSSGYPQHLLTKNIHYRYIEPVTATKHARFTMKRTRKASCRGATMYPASIFRGGVRRRPARVLGWSAVACDAKRPLAGSSSRRTRLAHADFVASLRRDALEHVGRDLRREAPAAPLAGGHAAGVLVAAERATVRAFGGTHGGLCFESSAPSPAIFLRESRQGLTEPGGERIFNSYMRI